MRATSQNSFAFFYDHKWGLRIKISRKVAIAVSFRTIVCSAISLCNAENH